MDLAVFIEDQEIFLHKEKDPCAEVSNSVVFCGVGESGFKGDKISFIPEALTWSMESSQRKKY